MSVDSSGKISLALGGAKKLGKPAPTNGVKRAHAALHGHDDEDNEVEHGKTQTVSHFDKSAGGAIDAANKPREKQMLVIAPQANRDWQEASGRKKRQMNGQAHIAQGGSLANGVGKDADGKDDLKASYGLIVHSRSNGEESAADATANDAPAPVTLASTNGDAPATGKTVEERAMDALLGKTTTSTLVLPAVTEEEAFERDFKAAPDMATLDDYARVPVEEFGAALLRGMGWKDGEGIGRDRGHKAEKTKMPARRPALLGIGAKEEAAVAQELGTWGRAAKDRKGAQQVYNPILLRDKKTGELFTEQELEEKKKREERERYEAEFDEQEKRKEKERRRREREDSRDRHQERSERSRKKEMERGSAGRYDESEDDYRRRKEKERRRKDRDRERSHRGSEEERTSSRRHDDYERRRDRHDDHRR